MVYSACIAWKEVVSISFTYLIIMDISSDTRDELDAEFVRCARRAATQAMHDIWSDRSDDQRRIANFFDSDDDMCGDDCDVPFLDALRAAPSQAHHWHDQISWRSPLGH
jgi:hypothetical protein